MENSDDLKPGARMFLAGALEVPARFGHDKPGIHHMLLALLERYGPMAESLATGLRAGDYRKQIQESLERGETGEIVESEALIAEAVERARESGKAEASERDLAAVLLTRAGWTLRAEPLHAASMYAELDAVGASRAEARSAPTTESAATALYRPRARHPTPLLEQFGRDLCQDAIDGKLPVVLGRLVEVQAMMETLCRWTKRNPLLVGPAGVGKTAIVEGLAQRIVQGDVPPPIQGIRIFALQSSALVSGAGVVGKLEERMQAILAEASQDGIVLFIDEIHTIVGSGGVRQISDVGSLLKPALAKGEIACIGATTDAEYSSFIEQDRALERRFQPLRVQELSPEASREILKRMRERAEKERGVMVTEESLDLIILLSQQYLRNRKFPDKAIDILEQCVAYAMLEGLQEVTPSVVRNVAERMVGMPMDLGADLSLRLGEVKRRLILEAFCPEEAAEQVVQRLEIAMRSLDVVPTRPNAVLLVAGAAGEAPELAAQVLAQALYGSRERLIELDMTRFTHPADVTWLTGAPPGYVGHDNTLEFHLELAQQPWSVLLLSNVEASHPQAQEVFAQAFRSGFFTDARGRKVYLSDAVVVLTVTTERRAERQLGLIPTAEGRDEKPVAADLDLSSLLVPDLVAELDVHWQPHVPTADGVQQWLKGWVLPSISERCQRQGLELEWDPSVLKWLSEAIFDTGDLMQGERMVEEEILPLLIPYLQEPGKVTLSCQTDGSLQIQPTKGA